MLGAGTSALSILCGTFPASMGKEGKREGGGCGGVRCRLSALLLPNKPLQHTVLPAAVFLHLLVLWVRGLAGQAGPCGVDKAQWWSADGQAGLEASKMASFSQWASGNSWKTRPLGPQAGHRPPPTHPARQSHMVRILPRQLRTPAVSIPEGLLRAQSWNLPSCPSLPQHPVG